MSRIARVITKNAGIVALSATLFLQSMPVSALEITSVEENNAPVVQQEEVTEETALLENSAKEVEAAPEVKESVKVETDTAKENEDVVKISDSNLEKVLRKVYGVPATGDITRTDLAKVTEVSISANDNVKNLDGLQYCINLNQLTIDGVNEVDLSVIRNITSLKKLNISNCGDFDLNKVSTLYGLTNLSVDKIVNTNLDSIKKLTSIDHLLIYEAENLNDINGISEFKNLYALRINKNKVSDISVLSNLKSIELLDFSETNISDITVLAQLPLLRNAVLANNKITDVSGLYSLYSEQKIMKIWLDGNMISDPAAIVSKKVYYQTALNQKVTLPEVITLSGDVNVKLPYDKNLITSVEVDPSIGKYNADTNEITFYNVTSDRTVSYKVRMQDNYDGENMNNSGNTNPGYDYSAIIQQPLKIGIPVVDETNVNNEQAVNTTVKVASDSVKTGDASSLGTLSFVIMAIAGAVKTRKKR